MAYEIQKPYQERVRLFLQLPLIGLQAGFEAVFYAVGEPLWECVKEGNSLWSGNVAGFSHPLVRIWLGYLE